MTIESQVKVLKKGAFEGIILTTLLLRGRFPGGVCRILERKMAET